VSSRDESLAHGSRVLKRVPIPRKHPGILSKNGILAEVRAFIAGWAILGVLVLLGKAVWQLVPLALETGPLSPGQVALGVGWIGFMLYAEGYRGFQKAFSPRVVARALHLSRNPHWIHVLLAPAYAMGLIHAAPRRLVVSWLLLVALAAIVLLVRKVPQPYRGIIDAGVVLGLAWGIGSILCFAVRALFGRAPRIDLDLP